MADEFGREDAEPAPEFQAEEAEADKDFPSWRYGPGDQAEIFHRSRDVPAGWFDHPSKAKDAENKAKMAKARAAKAEKPKKPAKEAAKAGEAKKKGG